MAAPTLSTMRSNFRLLIQDTSTTSPGFTDAQTTTWINLALMWWYENNEKRIKTATAIASISAGTYEQDGGATFLYPEILGAHLDGSGVDGVQPLKRVGWNDIKTHQHLDAVTSSPVCYAALKYGAAGVGAAAQNLWKFAFWRVPVAGLSLECIVRDYPTALSADADIVDLGDFEAKCVEIIAAIFAAPRVGRPELAEDLLGLLPKMIQDKLDTHRTRDEAVA